MSKLSEGVMARNIQDSNYRDIFNAVFQYDTTDNKKVKKTPNIDVVILAS